jgi:hypothetical protein
VLGRDLPTTDGTLSLNISPEASEKPGVLIVSILKCLCHEIDMWVLYF